ncbi:PREDICTED: sulfotransferase family cytosolic 1B member 1-like isoform X1 [Priapulus caudatus]|uniref:Sulfotransferase family cytosolic 1B member 1-like isoform X1 n=1 Tax=Priapulus caudatus TaxID=37621 RepID=A0ABM1E2K5_PRICU|nr:PREDICTED: sulfotransferase family cytosolic 1B member 1-like isoform X1 [Priapulus caudatus]XP_014666426.1 PREDICTED: sulfotransferase family cytosolic 1B member 1-like isoform X1 [Priapulus caudatus]
MAEEKTKLPRHHGRYSEDMVVFKGMLAYMPQVRSMKVRDDDLIIATWIKCGTTWAQSIILHILNDADVSKVSSGGKTIDKLFPMIEQINLSLLFAEPETIEVEDIEEMPSPRFLKTHIPLRYLCDDIKNRLKRPKIIYVSRNPKDALTSLYHFDMKGFYVPGVTDDDYSAAPLSHLLQEFYNDDCVFGSYWKHNLEFWNRRNDENVLFIFYEDMIKDHAGQVKKIAAFLDKKLTDEQIQQIVEKTSFLMMRSDTFSNYLHIKEIQSPTATPFQRKGVVGDWKNHFTVAQSEEFDKVYQEKFAGTGLQHIFEI